MVTILAGDYGNAKHHRKSDSVFRGQQVQAIRKPPNAERQGAVREEELTSERSEKLTVLSPFYKRKRRSASRKWHNLHQLATVKYLHQPVTPLWALLYFVPVSC